MLAIAGGKGGCGKTTTAVGLGVALARDGASPLLVDGDCDMPDLHHVAGVERGCDSGSRTNRDTGGVDALANGVTLQSAIRTVDRSPRLAVLTGGKRGNLTAALHAVRRWPGPVIVDCPAGTTPVGTRPLRHADRAILLTTDRVQCVEDARRTAAVARELETAVAGFVVRETADGTVDPRVLTERVCRTVPTVDGPPLEDPRVNRQFEALASALSTREQRRRTYRFNNG